MDNTSIDNAMELFRNYSEAVIHDNKAYITIGGEQVNAEVVLGIIWKLIADADALSSLLDAVYSQLEPLVPDDLKSFDDDCIETRVNLITNPDDWR